jgi:transcriptional regulator with XRE-family HTH domain
VSWNKKKYNTIKELGERIKKIRQDNRLTLQNFADIFEVTSVAIKRWEDGLAEPPISVLAYLSTEYGYSLDWLILGTLKIKFNDNNKDQIDQKNDIKYDKIVDKYFELVDLVVQKTKEIDMLRKKIEDEKV